MKGKTISLAIFLLVFSTLISAQSRKKNTHNIGFDPVTQGMYIGFNHAINSYAIGLDLGSSLGIGIPLSASLSLDNALYFGNTNKYNLKTWHVNARFAYSKILVENKPNVLYVVPSIGKTVNLNHKLGLNIELGYGFQVLDDWGNPSIGSGTTYYFGGISNPIFRIELQFL